MFVLKNVFEESESCTSIALYFLQSFKTDSWHPFSKFKKNFYYELVFLLLIATLDTGYFAIKRSKRFIYPREVNAVQLFMGSNCFTLKRRWNMNFVGQVLNLFQ